MRYEGRIRTSALDWISLLLVIVGALVWGMVGAGMFLDAEWNLVNVLLGPVPVAEAIVYLAIGLAGLYEVYFAYQLYSARGAGTTTDEKPT